MDPEPKPATSLNWSEAWRTATSPGFRHLLIICSCGLTLVLEAYRFVSPFAMAELEHKRRELLEQATKKAEASIKATFDAERKAMRDQWEKQAVEDAFRNFQISQLQVEAKAEWREHVRFVALGRHDYVEAVVSDFEGLCRGWPCGPAGDCKPPSVAALMALKQRARR